MANQLKVEKSKESNVQFIDEFLSKYIEDFLIAKKKKSERTYINYKKDLEDFFKAVLGKEIEFVTKKDFESISLETLITYFNDLYELEKEEGVRKYANSTINRKQSTVKQLIRYLKARDIIKFELDGLDLIENLPSDNKNIEAIPFDTAMKYANWFLYNEKEKPLEKYLITKLAIDTGLRATELINLKWNQFVIDGDNVIMRGVGKGNKKWIEKISLEFYRELEQLKKDVDTSGDTRLFTIEYYTLANMMKRAKVALKHQDRNYSFHSFKKTAVTMAYRLTGDILEAQRKGRHSSLDTTRIYTQEEDYGITGLVSLGAETSPTLYKEVEHELLIKALESMNKDMIYILNSKINTLKNNSEN